LGTLDLAGLSPEELATRHDAAAGATISSQWATLTDADARSLLQICSAAAESALFPVVQLRMLSDIGP